jgi:hypothetical protein
MLGDLLAEGLEQFDRTWADERISADSSSESERVVNERNQR